MISEDSMKKAFLIIWGALMNSALIFSQTPPVINSQPGGIAVLEWTAGANDTGYNIYKAVENCPSSVSINPLTPNFSKLIVLTSATPTSYADNAVIPATTYCYFITGTTNTAESSSSNTTQVSIPPTCNPAIGLNWDAMNGWTCVTVAQLQAALGTIYLNESNNYYNFGTIPVNTSITTTVTLSSTGTQPVNITNLSIGGSYYSFTGAKAPLSLNPGQTVTLTIKFTPTKTGTFTATLLINSNSTTPTLTFNTSGTAQ